MCYFPAPFLPRVLTAVHASVGSCPVDLLGSSTLHCAPLTVRRHLQTPSCQCPLLGRRTRMGQQQWCCASCWACSRQACAGCRAAMHVCVTRTCTSAYQRLAHCTEKKHVVHACSFKELGPSRMPKRLTPHVETAQAACRNGTGRMQGRKSGLTRYVVAYL